VIDFIRKVFTTSGIEGGQLCGAKNVVVDTGHDILDAPRVPLRNEHLLILKEQVFVTDG
jgi:hypothetical protein